MTTPFPDAVGAGATAQVLPQVFAGRGPGETVRIWVPGCGTGEAVFALAMLALEHGERLGNAHGVQIFATDTDERALAVARAARYPEHRLHGMPEALRRRYFVREGGSFSLARAVRDLCVFSPHDAARDPPLSRLDLIVSPAGPVASDADGQARAMAAYHYALRPGGILIFCEADGPTPEAALFLPVEGSDRAFRRAAGVSTRVPLAAAGSPLPRLADSPGQRAQGDLAPALQQEIEAQVMERFAPPHVVVDRDGDVVHFSGRTGRYLEAAAGLPTRRLLTMARAGLRPGLRAALGEAVDGGARAVREGIVFEGDAGRVHIVTVTVGPLAASGADVPLFLVLFSDEAPVIAPEASRDSLAIDDDAALRLEGESRRTRERLQSLVGEYEGALEELKASNEELAAVNEELRSTNEELESSKEELQSVNEELSSVNAELERKVASLDQANADLHNLFASTDIATVFLDARLVIRSLTPAVTATLGILPSDRGRPITDFSAHLALPHLAEDVAAIMRGSETIERQIDRSEDQTRHLVRLAPYRSGKGRTEGVVVSFMDVTSLSRAELRQRLLVSELQHRTRNLLAVVQSIARRTLGAEPAVATYTERLKALGRVQGLFGRSGSGTVDLGDLVRLELRAHGAEESPRIVLSGPGVALDVEQVQTFALVLHELATNAVKHGALAQAGARLSITWSLDPGPDRGSGLSLVWAESGVAMPPGPERRGFGRELIEQALTYSLRARAAFVLGPDGVTCRIAVPL